ncbi:MAG TPA: [Fe-Fe] hydrogenase large subunit C-terminal domain-containing protein [Myxococcota bacterium]|nr:[Fe-Fe] hydrogenase large subunit C-terminal domain-containing protein [Myxococcota bacterium]
MALELVTTIGDRCKVCYTCVRECPAKAIRISGGQAEVIQERCIGCGNCVQVCSQKAKAVMSSVEQVKELLERPGLKVSACVAPSFPVEFTDCSPEQFIGMVRALGFDLVNEVAFGADLVSEKYNELVKRHSGTKRRFIATACAAAVEYVEHLSPHLTESLAPLASPMVAMARYVHRMYGDDVAVVFIGPCIAKKAEAVELSRGQVDQVLTFGELREMFRDAGIDPDKVIPTNFDPPFAKLGGIYPVSGGLVQTAKIDERLMSSEAAVVDGHNTFVEAIREFESGAIQATVVEVMACNGCIMGPSVSSSVPLYSRRAMIADYIRHRMTTFDPEKWVEDMYRYPDLDLSQTFKPEDRRMPTPSREEVNDILARLGKETAEDELNCGACGYDTCLEHAIAIFQGLAEGEMCLPHTIDQLKSSVTELADVNKRLEHAQHALVQGEKLASMGQLAAGIAHEVNNPLGVVLMYSHLLSEDCDVKPEMREDLKIITEQADRCKRIVSGLLNFARQNRVLLQPTVLRKFLESSLLGVQIPDNIKVEIQCPDHEAMAELDSDQLMQVFTNLLVNAIEAMPEGGRIVLGCQFTERQVIFRIADNGVGIPPENAEKVFTPFFTTKPVGRGTGLGLPVSYGIVKMHRGDIRFESNVDPDRGPTGTTFFITLPRYGNNV